MSSPVRAVIFDLDGTLVQTRVASWEVFEKINNRFGLGIDRQEQYFELFRGNVYESIAERCRDAAHAAEVKEAFLHLLRTDYTPPLVPGMADVVRRLAGGLTLAVMSSNAIQVLRRVLVANDLAFCFAHVFGGDVTPDKRTAIHSLLSEPASGYGRRCSADYDEAGRHLVPARSSTVLVTDTAGDVRDALAAGIRVIGVAWGMHSVDELAEAGAEFVALWPQEIVAHLLDDAAPATGACAVSPVLPRPARAGAPPVPSAVARTSDPVARAAAIRRQRRRVASRGDVLQAVHHDPPTAPSPATGTRPPAARAPHPVDIGDELLRAIRSTCASS